MAYRQSLSADTELIGDFRILGVLGSGGFANTYHALDLTLGREVAIKEFFPSDLAVRSDSQSVSVRSPEFEDRFLWAKDRFVREAKTLAKFRHPSVVRVFRIFHANETAYIVLEFVRGKDMAAWLKRLEGRPTQAELDEILPPLLDALEVVHNAGILHRDIKPANIYIRDPDQQPVLLDFGAAKYSTAGDDAGTTAAIVSKGYSPHEAYSTDSRMQGPWTDIYGFAATLYRALTGFPPPESTMRIMRDDLLPTARTPELVENYRIDFLEAIDKALGVFPRDRPQSVAEWRPMLLRGAATEGRSTLPADMVRPDQPVLWQQSSQQSDEAETIYTGNLLSSSTSHSASEAGIGPGGRGAPVASVANSAAPQVPSAPSAPIDRAAPPAPSPLPAAQSVVRQTLGPAVAEGRLRREAPRPSPGQDQPSALPEQSAAPVQPRSQPASARSASEVAQIGLGRRPDLEAKPGSSPLSSIPAPQASSTANYAVSIGVLLGALGAGVLVHRFAFYEAPASVTQPLQQPGRDLPRQTPQEKVPAPADDLERKRREVEAAEARRLEEERLLKEAVEAERKRREAEAAEARRLEEERLLKETAEAETKRKAAEAAEARRLETERLQKEAVEAERKRREAEAAEARRLETERLQKEAVEAERKRREAEAAEARRLEAERLQKEAAEAERKRKAAEAAEAERKRKAAEAAEAERKRKAAEAAEASRQEAERLQKEAAEAERKRKAAEAAEIERKRLDAEATEARLKTEEEQRVAAAAALQSSKQIDGLLSEGQRLRIKQSLKKAGHLQGDVDSSFDSATRKAIKDFQSALKETPTGYLTPSQMRTLFFRE